VLRSGTTISSSDVEATAGHVGIEVTNLIRAKKFYKTLLGGLGFKVIRETENSIGFANWNFSVWIGELREPRVSRKAPTGEELVVTDHLAFQVPNKKTVYEIEKIMKEDGFKALFPCEEHPQFLAGYYAVSFCDPDNYVIEIYTRPKPKQS